MPDYNTSAVPDGVTQGLDQIARMYQNGKIADSIVRVNPEMLQMLGMSKEQFGSMSSGDRSSTITGAITALGVKTQQIQLQQQQAAALAAQRSAAGRAALNDFVANDPGDVGQPAPAAPAPAATGTPGQITPGIYLPPPSAVAPQTNPAGFVLPQPSGTPAPAGLPPGAAAMLPQPGAGAAPATLSPGAMATLPQPSTGQRFLRVMAKAGMIGDPNADKVLNTIDRFDPSRFSPGPSQFDTQDLGNGFKAVTKRGSKEFQIISSGGNQVQIQTATDAQGNPYSFVSDPKTGKTTVLPPSQSARNNQQDMSAVVEGEKALQGIDGLIGKYNNQLANSKKSKSDLGYEPPAAPDPGVLTELKSRRSMISDAMTKASGGSSPATTSAAAAGAPPAAVQALMARAQQAIASGKDPVAVKALLAKKLKEAGYTGTQ